MRPRSPRHADLGAHLTTHRCQSHRIHSAPAAALTHRRAMSADDEGGLLLAPARMVNEFVYCPRLAFWVSIRWRPGSRAPAATWSADCVGRMGGRGRGGKAGQEVLPRRSCRHTAQAFALRLIEATRRAKPSPHCRATKAQCTRELVTRHVERRCQSRNQPRRQPLANVTCPPRRCPTAIRLDAVNRAGQMC